MTAIVGVHGLIFAAAEWVGGALDNTGNCTVEIFETLYMPYREFSAWCDCSTDFSGSKTYIRICTRVIDERK